MRLHGLWEVAEVGAPFYRARVVRRQDQEVGQWSTPVVFMAAILVCGMAPGRGNGGVGCL
jgi:hypothetical protein